jgi:NADH dehydrogenase (ubiquinone) Fe-S protein 3
MINYLNTNVNNKRRFNSFETLSNSLKEFVNKIYFINFSVVKYLQQCCSLFILNIAISQELIEITTSRKFYLKLLKFLKTHSLLKCTIVTEYTVIDHPSKELRFEIVLFLLSIWWNFRVKVRLFTNELFPVSTITFLFKIAFWQEREIWDLFGILFQNNMDLRRILTDYGFIGHPLRKDFPLTGYTEIFFDDFTRHIVTSSVSLAQEYRYYNFKNPWVV